MSDYDKNAVELLDWGEEQEFEFEKVEFEALPAGTYPFTIVQYDKGRYEPRKPGGKIPPCNMATVHFRLDASSVGKGEYTVKENYYLVRGVAFAESKMRELFTGCGLATEDGRFIPNFDHLIGKEGMVRISRDADAKDSEKFYNHVKKIEPKPKEEAYENF